MTMPSGSVATTACCTALSSCAWNLMAASDSALRLPLISDVDHDSHRCDHFALGVDDRRGAHSDIAIRPISSVNPDLFGWCWLAGDYGSRQWPLERGVARAVLVKPNPLMV